MTKNTLTDPELLKRELDAVRSKGIAFTHGEHQEGITGIAAPIFNFHGNVEGSVVVTLPSIRFSSKQKRFIEGRVRGAAAEISRQLGFDVVSGDIASNKGEKKITLHCGRQIKVCGVRNGDRKIAEKQSELHI